MSRFMQKLFARRFRDAAMDGGDPGGAAPARVDLGDEFELTPSPSPADPVDPATLSEEERAALPGDEPQRDAAGKFTKKEKPDTPMIPKARVDEMLTKERERAEAAERRLAELTSQSKKEEAKVSLTQLETKSAELRQLEHDALMDGDKEKAREFSTQRDALNRQIARIENQAEASEVSAQALETIRVETTISSLKDLYPQLDEKAAEYDQELVDDVLDKQRGYMERERMSPSAALAKAAKVIMGRQAQAPASAEGAGLAKGQNVDRKAAAVAKNVAAAAAQPANLKIAGMDSDKSGAKGLPDINKMSRDEYDALPEATKARMRGDVL